MLLIFEDRPSDSPYIERVWRSYSIAGGPFQSIAEGNVELVVTRLPALTRVTLRGPVTVAAQVDCPPDGQWVAIRFKPGTFFPSLPTAPLLNHHSVDLPLTGDGRFWLDGAAWEIPDYENAEPFVARLARNRVIVRDAAVSAAVAGDVQALTVRSVQRHFLQAVGMTHARFRQIERARHAVQLLHGGASILDAVHDAGYFDQAHLTRALTRLTGQTPLRILRREAQLSFLCKTTPPPSG